MAGDGEMRGWHPDPFGRYEERYFINGDPSELVRSANIEASDPPGAAPVDVMAASTQPVEEPTIDGPPPSFVIRDSRASSQPDSTEGRVPKSDWAQPLRYPASSQPDSTEGRVPKSDWTRTYPAKAVGQSRLCTTCGEPSGGSSRRCSKCGTFRTAPSSGSDQQGRTAQQAKQVAAEQARADKRRTRLLAMSSTERSEFFRKERRNRMIWGVVFTLLFAGCIAEVAFDKQMRQSHRGSSSAAPAEATTTTTYSRPAWLTPLAADTKAIGELMQRISDNYGNGDTGAVNGNLCQKGMSDLPSWRATLARIDNPSVSEPYSQALDTVQQTFVDCGDGLWTRMLRDMDDQQTYVQRATAAIQALPQP